MYVYYNANPSGKATGDCVIRAISAVTGLSWRDIHWDLATLSNEMYQMMDDNVVWHEYLRRLGFDIRPIQYPCSRIKDFGNCFPRGKYILGTGKHVAPEFDVHEIVQEFIDGGGQFMCYLIGHLHRDIFGYVYEYPKQPCIMVTTSNAEKASQEINADLGRTIGTKMQDAFNAVTFDKDSGIIKVIRIGADVDNVMRPRKAISYIIQSGAFPMN